MGLKHWILPNNQFKTHLFFSIFGWGDPFQLGSWFEGRFKLQNFLEKPSEYPYHIISVISLNAYVDIFKFIQVLPQMIKLLSQSAEIVQDIFINIYFYIYA